jgi:sugar lactone lactonase YvrE
MRLLPASVLLTLATSLIAVQAGTAVEQFQSLQLRLRKSHAANDWNANLVAAKELKALLNDDPDSLLEVARAEVHVSDFDAAFGELEQFVRMGQSTDLPARVPEFSVLSTKAEYAKIQSGMEANRTAVSRGSTVFLLQDSDLLAEDVDYDPRGYRFLVTSVREKKIVAVGADGTSEDFAKAPDNWPVMAIKIDRSHGVVWATEVATQGLDFAPKSDWGRSALLCYDLNSRKLLQRIEGPRGSALGDMALTTNGDVVVSDGDGGGVYRLPAKGSVLERLDGGDFISPQTPAMHPDGKHIFVPDYERGIAVLDTSTKQAHWLSTEGRFALNGIDGLYFDRGKLIAVQNGTSPERVVAFTLNATLSEITAETILERSTATLGDPTHGVVVGDDFYFLANSGWDMIDDHGNIKQGSKPSAPRMMRANIRGL